MTKQGNDILQDLYSSFRNRYVEMHPGCNENDVERAFLCATAILINGDLTSPIRHRIEAIR